MHNMDREGYIEVFRGDDSDALGYQTITATIQTEVDLSGCSAHFVFLDFEQVFTEIPEDKRLTIVIPASQSRKFPVGIQFATVYIVDNEGKKRTFSTNVPVIVKNRTECLVGQEPVKIIFNPLPQLMTGKVFDMECNDWTFRQKLALLWKALGGTVENEE